MYPEDEATSVYVLKLENGCWYVGLTKNIRNRVRKHFRKPSIDWLKKHKPLAVCAHIQGDMTTERDVALDLITLYGVDKVRGGGYSGNCNYHQENVPRHTTKHYHAVLGESDEIPLSRFS